MTIREDAYTGHQEAYDTLFGEITALLNNDTMIELKGAGRARGLRPEDVARDFLAENGIIPE